MTPVALDLDDDDELAVHADALAATDEPRAELHAVQAALARSGLTTVTDFVAAELPREAYAHAAALMRRQHVLLAEHRGRWQRDLLGIPITHEPAVRFHRGLPVALRLSPVYLAAIHRALAAAPSLRALDIVEIHAAELGALAGHAARVRELVLRIDTDDDLAPPEPTRANLADLLRHAPELTALTWWGPIPIDPTTLALSPRLAAFTGTLDDPGLQRLPALRGLRRIHLGSDYDMGEIDEPLRVFDGRLAHAGAIALESFALPPPAFDVVLPHEVDIAFGAADVSAIVRLVASPALRGVRELTLQSDGADGDPIVRALAAHTDLGELVALRLRGLELSADVARLLAQLAAPRLRTLAIDTADLAAETAAAIADRYTSLHALAIRARSPDIARALDAGHLRALAIEGAGTGDDGIGALLSRSRGLRSLSLAGCGLTDACELPPLPDLVALDLSRNPRFTAADAVDFPNLVHLAIDPLADQNRRIALRARLGEVIGAPPPLDDELLAVFATSEADVARVFAQLRGHATTVLDDDTLHAVAIRVPEGVVRFSVVARAGRLLKIYYRAEARAAADAIVRGIPGRRYREEPSR